MKNMLTPAVLNRYTRKNESDDVVLECAKLGCESMKILYDIQPIITNIWMNMSTNPGQNPQLPVVESLLLRIDSNLSSWISE